VEVHLHVEGLLQEGREGPHDGEVRRARRREAEEAAALDQVEVVLLEEEPIGVGGEVAAADPCTNGCR
jgi:hypothetical protein